MLAIRRDQRQRFRRSVLLYSASSHSFVASETEM